MSPSVVQVFICLFQISSTQPQRIIIQVWRMGVVYDFLVKLEGSFSSFVHDYFKEKGLQCNMLHADVDNSDVWQKSIDGDDQNLATCSLTVNKISWENYSRFVTVLASGYSVKHYLQPARFQNHRHATRCRMKLTLIYTMYCVQQLCKANGFRTVHHDSESEKFKAAMHELKEGLKFLKYIWSSKWPTGMETIKNKLFLYIRLDEEVLNHQGIK